MCNEIRNTSLNNNFTLVLSVPVYIPALVLIWSVYYMEKDICYYYQVLFPADNVAMNGILTVPVYCTEDTYKRDMSSNINLYFYRYAWLTWSSNMGGTAPGSGTTSATCLALTEVLSQENVNLFNNSALKCEHEWVVEHFDIFDITNKIMF